MAKAIKILGAGISGLSSAITLAQEGKEVQIYERYDKVGKRFRGDLQGVENWSSQENVLEQIKNANIETNFPFTSFFEVTLTNGKKSFTKKSHTPLFYLVKRGPFQDTLDTALLNQAEKLGVKIHYRTSLPQNEVDIIATGPIRGAVIAADRGVTFTTDLPNMAIAIFHDEFAYLGYSYLLVANGYGCLCSVVFRDLNRLNICFEKTVELAKKMYRLDLTHGKPVGGVGSYVYQSSFTNGNSLLVGEAAGFQDFLWGFGIKTAILSGHYAGKAILNNSCYKKAITKNFSNYLKTGIVNRYFWEKFKWKSTPIVPYIAFFPGKIRSKFHLLYNFTFLHRFFYRFAVRYIKKQYPSSIINHLQANEFKNDLQS